jgi:Flp pilus assembly protein TadG
MKKIKRQETRSNQRGSIAIIIAATAIALFGMAALAVDAGFWYTKSRRLQGVADAAVSAGMPALVAGNSSTATQNARNMATANGFAGATVTPGVGTLSVTVSATAPSFFAAIMGGGTNRLLTSTATGQVVSNAGPALLALGGCASVPGFALSGNGALSIQGSVESNGPLTFSTGGVQPQNVTGNVLSACGVPNVGAGPITFSSPPGVGGPFTDPWNTVSLASFEALCLSTTGTSTLVNNSNAIPFGAWTDMGGGLEKLNPGVYCSAGNLNLSGPGTAFTAIGVTIVAGGQIQIGANGVNSVLSAATGVPHNIVAYTPSNVGCAGGAMTVGNQNLTITGSVYAPNGCMIIGGNVGMTLNGSAIASDLQIGDNGNWVFNPGGGGGGTSWRMLN